MISHIGIAPRALRLGVNDDCATRFNLLTSIVTMTDIPPPAATGARLYALDNLRGILMWLGIVLHVTAIYGFEASPIIWRDEKRTMLADLLTTSIHAFRMPAFFMLAGFFAMLLAQSRGPDGLLRHRLARLALPFALFWPFLWVASGLAALAFLNRIALGQWGLDRTVIANLPIPQGPTTMHMWFLWMLLWFCVATSVLLRLPPAWFTPAASGLAWLARQPWGFAVLALPLLAAGVSYPRGFLVPTGAFLPPWNEWLHNGLFFVFGLMLYGRQTELFAQFQRRWAVCAAAGLLFYIGTGVVTRGYGPQLLGAYSYHCAGWLWSFACIGLALKFLQSRQAVLGYLSDSAYWVYLLHFPLTIIFGALLYQLPLPALLKIAINIAATTLVCVGSYQLFVRHTWVSQLLNGKRHPRSARAVPAAAGVA
jgi:fucose 4-O-acetylase-like acetyltransferase